MGQCLFDGKVGPTVCEAINGIPFSDVQRVEVCLIDFRESFDQVGRVGFVSAEPGSNRMGVDSDAQGLSLSEPPAVVVVNLCYES